MLGDKGVIVHSACAPKPITGLASKYAPEFFIGKYVKKSFAAKGPGGCAAEHMWVLIQSVRNDGALLGILMNIPEADLVTPLKCDAAVIVFLHEIEAIQHDNGEAIIC